MKSREAALKPLADPNDRLDAASETGGTSLKVKDFHASPEECRDSDLEAHKLHACYLKARGLDHQNKNIFDNPTMECHHCGAKVNCEEHICAARLGEEAANVEGGHGVIEMDQIGKSHAC
jgi:hypothetical protein